MNLLGMRRTASLRQATAIARFRVVGQKKYFDKHKLQVKRATEQQEEEEEQLYLDFWQKVIKKDIDISFVRSGMPCSQPLLLLLW